MRIYPKLFATFYDSFLHGFEQKLKADRMQMLSTLEGTIIDVGAGTGVNFAFFNDAAHIYAIEPAKEMLIVAETKKSNKNITFLNVGILDDAIDTFFEEKKVDAIVCTLVLCTIPQPDLALERFKKWLKPQGKLIIIEHIHSKNKFNARFQNVVNPIWNKIGEGCNLNRNTHLLLAEKGFISANEQFFTLGLRIVKGVYTLV